jgi:hypothetical protein
VDMPLFHIITTFILFLEGSQYVVADNALVTVELDMRLQAGRRAHFMMDDWLLPHAIVNIPNETMHVGVCVSWV